jgi:hypothetical protein
MFQGDIQEFDGVLFGSDIFDGFHNSSSFIEGKL